MTEDQLRQVWSLNWSLLYQKLGAFSISLAKLYFKKRYRNLPKGYTYEDVVQRAIGLALRKDFDKFDAERFEDYIFGAIKSIYWGLAISGENKTTRPLTHVFDESTERETINGQTIAAEPFSNDIHNELDLEATMHLITAEIASKHNAGEMIRVFDCIREGLEPRQISKKTGLPLKKITNCKRQLLRIVDNISKTLNDAESQK